MPSAAGVGESDLLLRAENLLMYQNCNVLHLGSETCSFRAGGSPSISAQGWGCFGQKETVGGLDGSSVRGWIFVVNLDFQPWRCPFGAGGTIRDCFIVGFLLCFVLVSISLQGVILLLESVVGLDVTGNGSSSSVTLGAEVSVCVCVCEYPCVCVCV